MIFSIKNNIIIILVIISGLSLFTCASSQKAQSTEGTADYLGIAEKVDEIDTIEADKLIGLIGFYLGRHRFDEALDVVQKVIAGFPRSVYSDNAYFLKGLIYSDNLNFEKDLKKAAAAFRMVLDSLPETEFDRKAERELEKIKIDI